MRFNITFDGDNYITSLKNAIDGQYELPDDFDFTYFNCYKLINDEFVLDNAKYEQSKTTDENNARIDYLEKLLTNTDYITARWAEEIMALDASLTWIMDAIKISKKYRDKYVETIKNRIAWREEIERLRR